MNKIDYTKYKEMWESYAKIAKDHSVSMHTKIKNLKVDDIKSLRNKFPEISKNSIRSSSKGILASLEGMSFSRMSTKEQTFFIKRLSFLLKAGIPMLESINMLQEQTRKKGHAAIFQTISDDIAKGQYLSTSLAKFKNMFGDFSINIIAFGESTGMLSENLEYLADELKKKDALKKKIIGALVYPIIVTIATFGITGFLMIYLFPKIMPVFSSLHIKLPLTTRIVISMSKFLTNHGVGLILWLIFFSILATIILKKSTKVHFYFDKTIMRIPAIGNMIKSYNLANATRTLGLLLKSGITLSESVHITSKVAGNLVYKEEFHNLGKVINRGERMSVYFATSRELFPDVLTQIVSVGERSGNLSHSLIYLSELYEAEVDDFTKNLSSMIEPILMIIMGIMVGFIAISIITPIYSITQNLHA